MIEFFAEQEWVEPLILSSPVTSELLGNYIAGERAADALRVVDDLTWKGMFTAITFLAEPATTIQEAQSVTEEYLRLVSLIAQRRRGQVAEITVRPATIGVGLEEKFAVQNTRALCSAAQDYGVNVTLEAETSPLVPQVLSIARELRHDIPNIGVGVNAMLFRSEDDCRQLAAEGVRVRLSKGIYDEPSSIAFKKTHEISVSFVRCLRILLAGGAYPMVVTHDPRLIQIAQWLADKQGLCPDDWELQMVMGIRPYEQRRIADIGQRMRVYVPYGPTWYTHYMRMLAERPDNLRLLARSMLGRR